MGVKENGDYQRNADKSKKNTFDEESINGC